MLTLCIDFDGTMVEHEFPYLGKPIDDSVYWMQRYVVAGAKIVLWTMRSGRELQHAVDYCAQAGIELYGVNRNPSQDEWTSSPKAYGNIYIADAAFGCPLVFEDGKRPYVDWSVVGPAVYKLIEENANINPHFSKFD